MTRKLVVRDFSCTVEILLLLSWSESRVCEREKYRTQILFMHILQILLHLTILNSFPPNVALLSWRTCRAISAELCCEFPSLCQLQHSCLAFSPGPSRQFSGLCADFLVCLVSSSCASVYRRIMGHLENLLRREITNAKIEGT